jgi:hypothetical protein
LSIPAASGKAIHILFIRFIISIVATAAILLVHLPAKHQGTAAPDSNHSFASQPASVASVASGRIQASYASLPLAFEQNQGQTDAQVQYLARGNGYTVFLTASDVVFSLRPRSVANDNDLRRGAELFRSKKELRNNARNESASVVRMQFLGANSRPQAAPDGPLPGKSNYFIGNDPSKWRSDVPNYSRVIYRDVYPGVNLAFHGAQRRPEFDFIVALGANPALIGLRFTGNRGLKIDGSGNLLISSAADDIVLHKPIAYQEHDGARQPVEARFILKANHQVSFELGTYDRSRELVIDPSVSIAYSTYLGGSAEDDGYGIAFDSSGNAYVTGKTASTNFPGTNGSNAGGFDVFVTKISADGSSLDYSTYIGGSGLDVAYGIAVDSTNEALVAGGTQSANFPVMNPYQSAIGSGAIGNAFIFELTSSGSLKYSTFFGGSVDDFALGIAFDQTTGMYAVAGSTASSDFPTKNAVQAQYSGGVRNGFVSLWNSSGNTLAYSTFIGGQGDYVGAVALDPSDNAYVTGQTFGVDFTTTSGSYQTSFGGDSDAFVSAIKASGAAYIYSTYLGGSLNDLANGIAVDSSGSAYVTGLTGGSFPVTSSALQKTYGGGASDAFVSKLNPAGSALVYSTYLGGSAVDFGAAIAVDGSGNAYVTGQTASSDFSTVNPTQSALNGASDAYVSVINPSGSQLSFSTYLGGSGNEDISGDYAGIAVDSPGATIYVTGDTVSSDFPHTTGSAQPHFGGGAADGFAVKFTQAAFTVSATTPAAVSPGSSATSTVTLTALNGYNSPVNLSCSISGSGSPLPACNASSFQPNQVTPVASGATSTLTITTTGPSSAVVHPGKIFYAMWLPIAGLFLTGIRFSSPSTRSRKLLGFLIPGIITAALFLLPACGSVSKNGGGGGGGGNGTPAGNYTVTITGTGTDSDATTRSTQITLTVNPH